MNDAEKRSSVGVGRKWDTHAKTIGQERLLIFLVCGQAACRVLFWETRGLVAC